MNNWMTLEEFQKYVSMEKCVRWCWVNYTGIIDIAFYNGEFYLDDSMRDGATYDLNNITHVMIIEIPSAPRINYE